MKTISVALKAHIAGQVTTLASCWKVTLQSGAVRGFTDYQADLVVSGVTYAAATGFSPSAITQKGDLSVSNMNLVGFLQSPTITEADLLAGVWDFATVEIFMVNYNDLTMGTLPLRKGTLGQVSNGRISFEAEMRSLTQRLQQNILRVYQPSCDATLGDTRCTKDLTAFTVTGIVTAVASQKQFTDSSRAEASDYFGNGLLTWSSGNNSGFQFDVKSFASGVFTFYSNVPYAIQVGDTYTAIAGCRHRLSEDCITKFNNVLNFQGFPFVPGMDWQQVGKQ